LQGGSVHNGRPARTARGRWDIAVRAGMRFLRNELLKRASLASNTYLLAPPNYINIRLTQRCNLRCLYCMPKENIVHVKFKGKSKCRFGCIKSKGKDSLIEINSLFMDERVPEFVIDTTLAHELVHYMHGFNSPLPRKYRHPHRGGIVDKELIKRGFGHSLRLEKVWAKKDWEKVFALIKE